MYIIVVSTYIVPVYITSDGDHEKLILVLHSVYINKFLRCSMSYSKTK